MEHILVANAAMYVGQYVTTADFGDVNVITSSESAIDAYRQAVAKGFNDPVIIYVPKEDELAECL